MSVDIDIFHKIDFEKDIDPKGDSYFIEKMKDNYGSSFTNDFTNFYHEIYKKCENLASILYHREEILDTLLRYITKPEQTSLGIFLE